jgi:hypothetical protein
MNRRSIDIDIGIVTLFSAGSLSLIDLADLAKHLFLYNAVFDFMALFTAGPLVGEAVHGVLAMRRRLRPASEQREV